MRIGIDARALTEKHVTGIGKHLAGLLTELRKLGGEHEWLLYSNYSIPLHYHDAARWSAHRVSCKGVNGPLWLNILARGLAVEHRLDAFWGPCFFVPYTLPRRMAVLASLHDLVYPLYADTMRLRMWTTMKLFYRSSIRRSDHVFALSESTATDLVAHLEVPRAKITIAPPGVAPVFHPRPAEEVRAALAPLGVGGGYILAVGTLEPRKNLATLVRAFLALPEADRRARPLLLAGSPGWKSSNLAELAAPGLREGTIRFLGYVRDEDLPALYSGATLVAAPSLYEGFGMPVIEAMACGAPVLLSDIPVFHEVAGEAAAFVDARDPAAWTRELHALLHDPARRDALRARGLERATRFTFASSAATILSVIERLGREKARGR